MTMGWARVNTRAGPRRGTLIRSGEGTHEDMLCWWWRFWRGAEIVRLYWQDCLFVWSRMVCCMG